MLLEGVARSREPEEAVRARVRRFLEGRGYRLRRGDAERAFQRGSLLGSLTAFTPRRWGARATIAPAGDGLLAVRLRVNTIGQIVGDHDRRFFEQELASVIAVSEGRAAADLDELERASLRATARFFKLFALYGLPLGIVMGLVPILLLGHGGRPLTGELIGMLTGTGVGIGAVIALAQARGQASRDGEHK
jgi:hypothetical protein